MVLTVLLTVILSGCALKYGDGLLVLPSLPNEYQQLQKKIDETLATGAVATAAETGAHRQSIQLVDINGDGESEAVAFFRESDGGYLIKVYRREGDAYIEMGSAQMAGASIHAVSYPIVSVSGRCSVAVSVAIDESNNYNMFVYSFSENRMEQDFSLQYISTIAGDLYQNALDELCFVVKEPVTGQLRLKIFALESGSYMLYSEIGLSSEAKSVAQMSLGFSSENRKAVFIDSSSYFGGYVTDVIEPDGSTCVNISVGANNSAISVWRDTTAFSMDIDKDGITEVPVSEEEVSSLYPAVKGKLGWYTFGAGEEMQKRATTFMDDQGRWYMIWPENWDGRIVAQTTKHSKMTKTTFFILPETFSLETLPQPDEGNIVLTVFQFTGENRRTYLPIYNATPLVETEGNLYAFAAYENAGAYNISKEQMDTLFVAVEREWDAEGYAP